MRGNHTRTTVYFLFLLFGVFALFSCTPDMSWNSDFIVSSDIRVGTQYIDIVVTASETQYYDFVAAANAAHTIRLTSLDSDMGWQLFSSPSYSSPGIIVSVNTDIGGSGDEVGGTGALVSGQKYYIAVEEYGGTSGMFDILITYP